MITIEEAISHIPRWAAATVSVAPLVGGITNLHYRVEVDGQTFALAISSEDTARLDLDRHRTHQCTVAASRSGVGPQVEHALPDEGVLVTRFIFGRPLDARETARPDILARIVHAMHQYHAGPDFSGAFSPFRTLEAYLRGAQACGQPLPEDIGDLYRWIAAIEASVEQHHSVARPCHNDLWESNLLDDGERIRIIDWEYAGMGDVSFDLANFAMHGGFSDTQDDALVEAYFGSLAGTAVARLKLLKIVAELREAMWAVVAQTLSVTVASGFDCAGYSQSHFDRCRQALRDRRLSAWLRTVR